MACASLAACLPVFVTGKSGGALPVERVQAIRPEVTTARELLEWLGPPAAVGAPGAVFRVPVLGVRKVGSKEVAARPAAGGWGADAERPGDLVYYWEAIEVRDAARQYDVYPGWRTEGTFERRMRADRLWVLVAHDEGRVRAVAHDRAETGDWRAPQYTPPLEPAAAGPGREPPP